MFNIVSAWGMPTNPKYDPDTANNGGGYWQFAGGTMADASIDAPEEIDAVLASISGVLGVNAADLMFAALDAADICAQEVSYAN